MKEEDIRPAGLHEEYLRLSKEGAETFFSNKSDRTDLPCPAYNCDKVNEVFVKDDFGYVLCDECGTLYQSPRPSIKDFEKLYINSPSSSYWVQTFFPRIAKARRDLIFKPRVNPMSDYLGLYQETKKII